MKLRDRREISMLDNTDKRKYMTDREILEKYINLDTTCLTEKEREEIWICYISIRKHLV